MSPDPTGLRCAVVGARRCRQGTGPYIARFLHRAGAEVAAVATTSEASLDEARARLRAWGIEARGYTDVAGMLDREDPDLLVVASPAETHHRILDLATDARCHVLCEKPFVWGVPDPERVARALVSHIVARGRHVGVITQWPQTLDAYATLHPGVLDRPPTRFEMELAPARGGRAMVPDAVPHALSLLRAVMPGDGADLDDVSVEVGEGGRRAEVRFAYRTTAASCRAWVRLRQGATAPKPAAYAFDGYRVDREIGEDYAMAFVAVGRRHPFPDPLERLVQAFLRRLSSGEAARADAAAWPGTGLVARIAGAWPSIEGAPEA
jgi:predicted dehydrogenase